MNNKAKTAKAYHYITTTTSSMVKTSKNLHNNINLGISNPPEMLYAEIMANDSHFSCSDFRQSVQKSIDSRREWVGVLWYYD